MKDIGSKYECYSKKVYGYLTMKGFRYEHTFIHNTTKRKAWVYIVSKELAKALKEYSKSFSNY